MRGGRTCAEEEKQVTYRVAVWALLALQRLRCLGALSVLLDLHMHLVQPLGVLLLLHVLPGRRGVFPSRRQLSLLLGQPLLLHPDRLLLSCELAMLFLPAGVLLLEPEPLVHRTLVHPLLPGLDGRTAGRRKGGCTITVIG